MSMPETLPTKSDVQAVFERHTRFGSIGLLDDDALRFEYLREELIPSFLPTIEGLHGVLTVRHEGNNLGLSGARTFVGHADNPDSYVRHGMDRHRTLKPFVLPAVQKAFDQLSEQDVDMKVKLHRMAIMAGASIAASQVFSDGNTRIARAVHDYVRFGRDGVNIDAIYDSSRNFSLPAIIESLILHQNVTRLLGYNTLTDLKPLHAVHVPDNISGRISEAKQTLSQMYGRIPMIDSRESILSIITRIQHSDESVAPLALALAQEDYGPAAYLVVSSEIGTQPDFPINTIDADALITTDRRLHSMRMMSIVAGALDGGRFVSVTSGADGHQNRKIDFFDWRPTILAQR